MTLKFIYFKKYFKKKTQFFALSLRGDQPNSPANLLFPNSQIIVGRDELVAYEAILGLITVAVNPQLYTLETSTTAAVRWYL